MYSNNQGDNISIEANGGETLVAIAFGLRSFDPFDLKHGTAPYGEYSSSPLEYTTPFGFTQGLNDFNANPVISDGSAVTPESPVSLELGVANQFAVLGSTTVTSAGIWTIVNGLVGVAPGTSITGTFVPPTFQINTPLAISAQAAANSAYNYYKGLPAGTTVTQLSGMTLTPGTYTASSALDLAASGNVNFNAGGNPNAVFVIQVGTAFTSNTLSTMTLQNGAQAANIIFVCGSAATLNGASIVGTYITGTAAISLSGGGIFTGRVISLTAAVTNASTSTTTNTPGTGGGAANNWVLVCNLNLIDSDYVAAIPPAGPFAPSSNPSYTPPNNGHVRVPFAGGFINIPIAPVYSYNPTDQWQSSKWNLDGYYPSLYVWVATDVEAGTYDVNLNSVFQNGIVAPQDLAAGKPIFDGGVNFQVLKLQGTGSAEDCSIGTSTANPATAPATITTTAGDGDALITVGLMKSGNVFAPGTIGGTPTSLTLTQVTPLLYGPYSAPIREGGAIYTGTITGGANNAFVGYLFTVTGFVNEGGANNGVFTCTASTPTTLTLTNGSAVNETHSGAAAYTVPMAEIANGTLVGSEAHYSVEYALVAGNGASYNPGFSNPLGYEMVVCSIAIKSS
jgi:hypothetical protein